MLVNSTLTCIFSSGKQQKWDQGDLGQGSEPQHQGILLPIAKNKQTKTEYLHFQEKADMWPLFSSNIWAMHLKLSDTLCVQNVRQIVVIQGKHLGLRPGNNQTHLKAAGEKYCSSPWVMMMPQISRGSYKRQTWTLNTSQEWGAGQITEEGFLNQQSPLTILWEIKIESE